MTFDRSFAVSSSCFALLLAIGVAACTGGSSPSVDSKKSSSTVDEACQGKGCGVDCSPPGSDEPFRCDSAGQCVAAPEKIDCPACPEFLGDCSAGTIPGDLDGDGCIDGCKSVCEGKACGVDCTSVDSDEPFNCNSSGQCVAAGQPLGC